MSVIALDLVPATWGHKKIITIVCGYINRAQFQILAWGPSKNGDSQHKAVYFEISKELKPKRTLDKLMEMREGPFYGFIPTEIPHNPKMKCRFLSPDQKKALGLPVSNPKSFNLTLRSILYELQVKYNGLYNFSSKCEHKLMENITKVIYTRLAGIYRREIGDGHTTQHCTMIYRHYHKHSDDFNLVKDCLAAVESELGLPASELDESDIILKELAHNDPAELKAACKTFANLITKETDKHISTLDSVCANDESPEQVARKKIRIELQNVSPYLKDIMHLVLKNHFCSDLDTSNRRKILLIGEPKLPIEGKLDKFLLRFKALNKHMSETNYNMVEFIVPKESSAEIMSMDSTVYAGSKLLIRPADSSLLYQIPASTLQEIDRYLESAEKPK